MTMTMTTFDNPVTIIGITAHYTSPKGREGMKDFETVADYHRWENKVDPKGYDIHCVDISRVNA